MPMITRSQPFSKTHMKYVLASGALKNRREMKSFENIFGRSRPMDKKHLRLFKLGDLTTSRQMEMHMSKECAKDLGVHTDGDEKVYAFCMAEVLVYPRLEKVMVEALDKWEDGKMKVSDVPLNESSKVSIEYVNEVDEIPSLFMHYQQ